MEERKLLDCYEINGKISRVEKKLACFVKFVLVMKLEWNASSYRVMMRLKLPVWREKIGQEWKIQISNLKQAENSLFLGLVEESLPFVVKVQGMNPCLKNYELDVPAFICYIKIRSKE